MSSKTKLIILISVLVLSMILLSATYISLSRANPFGFIFSGPGDQDKVDNTMTTENQHISIDEKYTDEMYNDDIIMIKKYIFNDHWEMLKEFAYEIVSKYTFEDDREITFLALSDMIIDKNVPQNLFDITQRISDPEIFVLLFCHLSTEEQRLIINVDGVKILPQYNYESISCCKLELTEDDATYLITLIYKDYPYYVYVNKQSSIKIVKIEDKNQRLVDVYK